MNLSVDVYRVKQIQGYLLLNQLKCEYYQKKYLKKKSVDFYGPLPNGEKLLSIIDLYLIFPFIEKMKATTAVKFTE